MKLKGDRKRLMEVILMQCPDAEKALENSARIRGQLEPYQAAVLFALAQRYDGGRILEIGTLHGYSASIIAQAAPEAEIITLNSAGHEMEIARRNLAEWANVEVKQAVSWELLETYEGPEWNMVFVDGDHKRVARDVPWWDWVAEGGLILFHDYSPMRCPPVYEAVNGLGETLGREPDILIMDDEEIGMAGFYKEG